MNDQEAPVSIASIDEREQKLTDALCYALIIKKRVCPDRFDDPAMVDGQIQCPRDCHCCCKSTVTLDLTAVESLTIYLMNRELIHVMDAEIILQNPNGYCPFLIQDKCIINTFKPTACQMFMPFAVQGKPMCIYLAGNQAVRQEDGLLEYFMNSNAYAIHGCMVIAQHEVDSYLPAGYFKNIYAGVLWWENNYNFLPANTKASLESIINEETAGLALMANFNFQDSLMAGYQTYTEMLEKHQQHPAGLK